MTRKNLQNKKTKKYNYLKYHRDKPKKESSSVNTEKQGKMLTYANVVKEKQANSIRKSLSKQSIDQPYQAHTLVDKIANGFQNKTKTNKQKNLSQVNSSTSIATDADHEQNTAEKQQLKQRIELLEKEITNLKDKTQNIKARQFIPPTPPSNNPQINPTLNLQSNSKNGARVPQQAKGPQIPDVLTFIQKTMETLREYKKYFKAQQCLEVTRIAM